MRARRKAYKPGTLAEDYIEHLLFAMELTWNHRFLLRDRVQFAGNTDSATSNLQMAEDLEEFSKLLGRIQKEDYLRKDLPIDIAALTRALWIVSRYWMDHLREMDGLQ